MKAVDFSTLKRVQKMTLNQFNAYMSEVVRAAWQNGVDDVIGDHSREEIVIYDSDELYKLILSVKGIGEKRAQTIVDTIYTGGST